MQPRDADVPFDRGDLFPGVIARIEHYAIPMSRGEFNREVAPVGSVLSQQPETLNDAYSSYVEAMFARPSRVARLAIYRGEQCEFDSLEEAESWILDRKAQAAANYLADARSPGIPRSSGIYEGELPAWVRA